MLFAVIQFSVKTSDIFSIKLLILVCERQRLIMLFLISGYSIICSMATVGSTFTKTSAAPDSDSFIPLKVSRFPSAPLTVLSHLEEYLTIRGNKEKVNYKCLFQRNCHRRCFPIVCLKGKWQACDLF